MCPQKASCIYINTAGTSLQFIYDMNSYGSYGTVLYSAAIRWTQLLSHMSRGGAKEKLRGGANKFDGITLLVEKLVC